jgi:hypothetical protein
MTEMPSWETSRSLLSALALVLTSCCTVEVSCCGPCPGCSGVAKAAGRCSERALLPGVPIVLFSGAPGLLPPFEGVVEWIVWLVLALTRGVLEG